MQLIYNNINNFLLGHASKNRNITHFWIPLPIRKFLSKVRNILYNSFWWVTSWRCEVFISLSFKECFIIYVASTRKWLN